MSTPPSANWKSNLRAGWVAFLSLFLLVTFTPGLDNAPSHILRTDKQVQKWGKKITLPVAYAGKFLMDLQRDYRKPMIRKIAKILRPLRVNQNWRLYGDGPKFYRKMEIWVDDRLRYRSQDRKYQWREATWRYRRIRPIPETCAKACKKKPRNRKGLSLLVAQLAQQEFAGAQKIEIRFLSDVYPGINLRPTHTLTRKAPLWQLEEMFHGAGPCK